MKTQDEKLGKRLAQGLEQGIGADKYRDLCPDDATFFEFTEATLPAPQMEECQLHLAQCIDCREAYSLIKMPDSETTLDTSDTPKFWTKSWKQMAAIAAALILFAPSLYESINPSQLLSPEQPLVLETMAEPSTHDFYAIIYLDAPMRVATIKSLDSGKISPELKAAITLAEPALKDMKITKWALPAQSKEIAAPKYLEVYVTAGSLRLVVAP